MEEAYEIANKNNLQIKNKDIEEINDESIFIDDMETIEHKNRLKLFRRSPIVLNVALVVVKNK